MAERGSHIGAYTIVERIGAGGMAETYLAVRRGPGDYEQRVCLKLVLPAFEDHPEFLSLFMQEATFAASLRHSNVVGVIELGETEGRHFLALELVDGVDMRTLIKSRGGRALPPDVVIQIATELAHALDYSHSRTRRGKSEGLVHRDVSPSNVLLSYSGEVKLSDFGIAKAMSRAQEAASHSMRGKAPYAAPEHVLGRSLDGRSDLFSLGIVLYEALAGKRPFDGATELDTVYRITRGEREPLKEAAPETPDALVAVVERLLQVDPDARYASAADLLEALSPISVPPTTRRVLGRMVHSARAPRTIAPGDISVDDLKAYQAKLVSQASSAPTGALPSVAAPAPSTAPEASAPVVAPAVGADPAGAGPDRLAMGATIRADQTPGTVSRPVVPAPADAETRTRLPDLSMLANAGSVAGSGASTGAAAGDPVSVTSASTPRPRLSQSGTASAADAQHAPALDTSEVDFSRARRVTAAVSMPAPALLKSPRVWTVAAGAVLAAAAAFLLLVRPFSDEGASGPVSGTVEQARSGVATTSKRGRAKKSEPIADEGPALRPIELPRPAAVRSSPQQPALGAHDSDAHRIQPRDPAPPETQLLQPTSVASTPAASRRSASDRQGSARPTDLDPNKAKRSTAPRRATLQVDVLPVGRVWVDGRLRGHTPVVLRLRPGTHRVAAGQERPGRYRTIDLAAGDERRVVFDLALMPWEPRKGATKSTKRRSTMDPFADER